MGAKQVMVSTISRKSPISRDPLLSGRPVLSGGQARRGSRRVWWLLALLLVAALLVYAWIDGGYREVRVIEQQLDPAMGEVGPDGAAPVDASAGDAA